MQDLTKITTPFGLLDEEIQQALRAYKGPIEIYTGEWGLINRPKFNDPAIVYRAKTQPVRGEVVLLGNENCFDLIECPLNTHSLTLPTIDGKLITGEYRNNAGDVIKVEAL